MVYFKIKTLFDFIFDISASTSGTKTEINYVPKRYNVKALQTIPVLTSGPYHDFEQIKRNQAKE